MNLSQRRRKFRHRGTESASRSPHLRPALRRFFEVRQHFFRMPIGLHVLENVLDLSLWADNEGSPRHAPDFLAVHVLIFHDPKGLCNFLVGIGQQRERQVFLILELLLRLRSIWGDAKQHGTGFLNLFIYIAEPASLNGSTGGVGSWVKIENDGLAAQVLERDFFSVLVLQTEVGSLIIDVHGYFSGKIEVERN